MRSLVVYESWFGNTQRIAEEIADVLAAEGDVAVLSVDDPLPSLLHVDLVVLGAPTHVHGLSSGRSRQGAIDQRGGAGETGIGVRGWIEQLPLCGGAELRRVRHPRAQAGAARRLRCARNCAPDPPSRLPRGRRARELLRLGYTRSARGGRARACGGVGAGAGERGDEPGGMIARCTTTLTTGARMRVGSGLRSR